MTPESAAARALVDLMADAPRGPKRDGLFAVWLTLRVVEDLTVEPPHAERAVKRRVSLLQRRLGSLTLPAGLRRGLAGVLDSLPEACRRDAPDLLARLTASARDGLGAEVGDSLARGLETGPD